MCLLTFAVGAHARYPFVFAGNRDEFHARPTAAANWWDDADRRIFGGRDLQAGGGWLAVSTGGRFAVVTNFRDGHHPAPGARSRGELVHGYLRTDISAADFLAQLGDDYAGFSLIVGRIGAGPPELYYHSNRAPGDSPRRLEVGLYALSNHLLDTPWPKVERARHALRASLDGAPDDATLFAALADRRGAPDEALPDTGVDLEVERLLAAPFIVSDAYGTRASTLLWVDDQGGVRFVERSFDRAGATTAQTEQVFTIER